ncbi:hypothetical protein ABW21_db0201010 [Orbilia brochopaga]|nr:hypothetical protein ABW21_db0201010 [Drechslerella brochopaga]
MGSYLPGCIPTDLDDFDEFEGILTETSDFEGYLSAKNWLGSTRGELRDWVSRAPRIWLNRRRESALELLRTTFASGLGQRHRVERVEQAKAVDGVLEEAPKPIDEADDHWDTNWDVEIDDEGPEKKSEMAPSAPETSKQETHIPMDEDEDVSGWGLDDDIDLDDEVVAENTAAKTEILPTEHDEGVDDNMDWSWGDEEDGKKKGASAAQNPNGKLKETEKDVEDITLRETYSITSIPQEVINIILHTIQEAEKLSQPQYANLRIASSTSGLLTIPASILTTYRALSSIFYRDDPSPAICIYNDCEWLEEHLVELEKDVKSRSGPFSGFDLQPSIKAISAFGRRAYWKEMDTLSRSALLQSLGSLLNTVVTKFINDVEDLGDISADASVSLASYVTEIGKLETLFVMPDQPKDAVPMTAVYCEKWLKFQYLGTILDSTMVEITELWRDGALVDFDRDELIDLVKALFADGEKRSKTIEELRRF